MTGFHEHYSDDIKNAIASLPFMQAQIKENVKAPRHQPFLGEFTGDRWIPWTNGE